MAGLNGGVSDILSNHRLAETVGAHDDEVARFGDEVQCESAFDDGAVDFSGPVPIEVGHGPESADAGTLKTALQGKTVAFLSFRPDQFLQHQLRRPTRFSGSRHEVVQAVSRRVETEL